MVPARDNCGNCVITRDNRAWQFTKGKSATISSNDRFESLDCSGLRMQSCLNLLSGSSRQPQRWFGGGLKFTPSRELVSNSAPDECLLFLVFPLCLLLSIACLFPIFIYVRLLLPRVRADTLPRASRTVHVRIQGCDAFVSNSFGVRLLNDQTVVLAESLVHLLRLRLVAALLFFSSPSVLHVLWVCAALWCVRVFRCCVCESVSSIAVLDCS